MRLLISGDSGTTSIAEVENLNGLSVHLIDADRSDADGILRRAGLGWIDGEHAWLSITHLRGFQPEGKTAWSGEFDAMVRYAARHGWVNDTGLMVRGHIEGGR